MGLTIFKLSFRYSSACLLKQYANKHEAYSFETESTVLYTLNRRLNIDSTSELDSSNVTALKQTFDIPYLF